MVNEHDSSTTHCVKRTNRLSADRLTGAAVAFGVSTPHIVQCNCLGSTHGNDMIVCLDPRHGSASETSTETNRGLGCLACQNSPKVRRDWVKAAPKTTDLILYGRCTSASASSLEPNRSAWMPTRIPESMSLHRLTIVFSAPHCTACPPGMYLPMVRTTL